MSGYMSGTCREERREKVPVECFILRIKHVLFYVSCFIHFSTYRPMAGMLTMHPAALSCYEKEAQHFESQHFELPLPCPSSWSPSQRSKSRKITFLSPIVVFGGRYLKKHDFFWSDLNKLWNLIKFNEIWSNLIKNVFCRQLWKAVKKHLLLLGSNINMF